MGVDLGNAQHVGARKNQQDSFGFTDPGEEEFVAHAGVAAVVADGMGGLAHGELASQTAVRTFLAEYRAKTAAESIPDALARSLLAANAAVGELGAEGELGTTFVGAVLQGRELHWITVGDSALLLFRGGQFLLLAEMHVYGAELDQRAAAGEITAEEAARDPQREAVTSFLGLRQLTRVERSGAPLVLEEGDRVLLASDGLFKSLPTEEMAAAMGGPMQGCCEELVARVMGKAYPYQDNVTVVGMALEAPPVMAAPVAEPLVEAVVAPEPAPEPTPRGRGWMIVALVAIGLAAGAAIWKFAPAGPPPPPAQAPADGRSGPDRPVEPNAARGDGNANP